MPATRRSQRSSRRQSSTEKEGDDPSAEENTPESKPTKRGTKKRQEPERSDKEKKDEIKEASPQQNASVNKESRRKKTKGENASAKDGSPKKKQKSRKSAEPHQRQTERDETPKLWDADNHKDSYTFRIASWNVAGLRALVKNRPTALADIVTKHNLDVLCLQETKLQESHVGEFKGMLLNAEGFDSYYSCSVGKKGYSGTAVFCKRRAGQEPKQKTMDSFFGKAKQQPSASDKTTVDASNLVPVANSDKMGKTEHDSEGRIITLDFPLFSMTNVYVPNSGQKLDRLDYRTEEWDKDFLAFLQEKQKERPVFWMGDLNVAHTAKDVWNDGAKHLAKQAGVTAQERASFQEQLDSGFVDAFRHLHPEAKGCYTYWSQRAGNREPNKGLRLDYFICDPRLFDDTNQVVVRDSYMLYDVMGSDHCPVVLELEIKK